MLKFYNYFNKLFQFSKITDKLQENKAKIHKKF